MSFSELIDSMCCRNVQRITEGGRKLEDALKTLGTKDRDILDILVELPNSKDHVNWYLFNSL